MPHPSAVFYGHGGFGNRGCEAIVRSTADLLKAQMPEASITLCSERFAEDRQAKPEAIRRVLPHEMQPLSPDRLLYAAARRLGASQAFLDRRIQGPVIRRVLGADIALSIGGDTYCYAPPRNLYAVNRAAQGKTPLVLWACSVTPEALEGEMLADLRRYDRIFARESLSFETLSALELPVRLCSDPAFWLAPEEVPLPPGFQAGGTVGLNLSPLALRHAGDADAALSGAVALVSHILAITGGSVALIPHVRWAHDDDLSVLEQIYAPFAGNDRVLLLDAPYSAGQTKYLIARLSCLITARTHASIAAYSSGVPALVLGYSAKARGIARDLLSETPDALLPVQALSKPGQMIEGFEALAAGAQGQRDLLARRLPETLQRAQAAAAEVAQMAGWKP